jgi:hypothetical protein
MEKYDGFDGWDRVIRRSRTRRWDNSVWMKKYPTSWLLIADDLTDSLKKSFFFLCWSRDDLLGGAVCFWERARRHSICRASVAWVRPCASPPQTATPVLNEGIQARFLAVIGDQRYNPLEGDHRSSSIITYINTTLKKSFLDHEQRQTVWARPSSLQWISRGFQSECPSSLRMLGRSCSGEDLDPIKLGLWGDRVTAVIIIGLFGEPKGPLICDQGWKDLCQISLATDVLSPINIPRVRILV